MNKPKPVHITLLPESDSDGNRASEYRLLDRALGKAEKYRQGLCEARILLALRHAWSADRDGHLILGKAHKASEVERELLGDDAFDGLILINAETWPELNDRQREALLFHECLHFAVVYGDDGEPRKDERNRLCLRYVKHSIEEFKEVVEEYGIYKNDLAEFADALIKAKNQPLFPVVRHGVEEENGEELGDAV